MTRGLVLAGVALVLAGCATASGTYTQDGRKGYSIDCSGAMNSWGTCYTKAGNLCGARGYDILHRTGDQGTGFAGYANSGGGMVTGGTIISRGMQIACK